MLVVILNFNTLDDTLACLDSLSRQTWRDFEVLVIDNASRADDLGRIATAFPSVEVLALPQNLGWAGGNNVGLRRALDGGFAFACLLNSDTVLAPTALAELIAAAERVGVPCLLHPAIHYFHETDRAQLWPNPPEDADPTVRDLVHRHDIVPMNWAYGACLLLPTNALRRVGFLDERFFLQLEEEDYFQRAVSLGLRAYCARRARILHKELVSFGGRVTPDKLYYQVRNTLLLAEKHHRTPRGLWQALRRLRWAVHSQVPAGAPTLPHLLRWLISRDPLARAARQGVGDYARRRFGRRGER